MKSKFQEAFEGFSPVQSDEQIKAEIQNILDKHYDSLNNKDNYKLIHSCVDLTSLNPTDHIDHIYNFVKEVNELDENNPSIPPVAALCVYPNFVKVVKETLTVQDVSIACVSGSFPSSQSFLETKIVETGLAVEDGADEIDIVLHLGNFLAGNYQEVADEIQEIKSVCRNKKLKVILETGALQKAENIQRAAILSLYCDADFIKTSTGKEYPGASLESVYVMCHVLKEYHTKYGIKRGLKVSGGIRTTDDAVKYLCLVKEILGEEWMNSKLFRIGASSLIKDLHAKID